MPPAPRVLDLHHHVGTLPSEPQSPTEATEFELESRLATMDRNSVDAAVVIPGHGYLRPEGVADTRRVNDAIAAYRDARPDRFPAALGIVEPLYGPAGLSELSRMQDELGLVGVSVHARFQGVATDGPLVLAVLERAGELGLVPFVHAVAEVADEALWRVHRLARALPDLPIVVLDCFSSFEQGSHAFTVAELAPNLVFDTSLAYTVEPIVRFVRAFGAHRVVFGSDLYSHPLGYTRSRVLADLREADLSAADKAAILAGTAETLLGLSPPARAPIPTPLPPNRPRSRPRPPTAPPRTTRP
ncbi:amidohydrolase family protein [Embleya sp. NPDC050493]|uniref:amidohydrolase family protein n=1 Tax=Embleya sp. NPDC050493 TaxID=3363989 RepID=UPI0037AE07BC